MGVQQARPSTAQPPLLHSNDSSASGLDCLPVEALLCDVVAGLPATGAPSPTCQYSKLQAAREEAPHAAHEATEDMMVGSFVAEDEEAAMAAGALLQLFLARSNGGCSSAWACGMHDVHMPGSSQQATQTQAQHSAHALLANTLIHGLTTCVTILQIGMLQVTAQLLLQRSMHR